MNLTLPGADVSHEELLVQVVPIQADEFTCKSCFLVHHRSQPGQGESRQHVLHRMRELGRGPGTSMHAGL